MRIYLHEELSAMSSHDGFERTDDGIKLVQTAVISEKSEKVVGVLREGETLADFSDRRLLLLSLESGVTDEVLKYRYSLKYTGSRANDRVINTSNFLFSFRIDLTVCRSLSTVSRVLFLYEAEYRAEA